ncbi:hypothetical protein OESDEN_10639 [Oesophagostomum dentatum]|uniref:Uncharacterized protein n=1 Tax=Oesophagostomum dentatum TaxID=61180 RepID=A0A0B1SX45_OESDE|nr:hypothetical protein OESDEN_10639 [Oesophagostomum dentatum]
MESRMDSRFRFRGGSIEKPKRLTELTSPRFEAAETSSVSRCLRMPSSNDDTNLDQTLPMTMGDFYDSRIDSMTDDSGLFCNDADLKATSTPLRCSSQPYLHPTTSLPPVHNPYAEYSDKYQPEVLNPPSPGLIKSSPPTPSSFKRAMRDVQRQGTLQPRKLLTESTNVINASQEVKTEPQVCFSSHFFRLLRL